MSAHPRLEARVSAQERRQNNLEARIEELSEDMTASFKQVSDYLNKIEERLDQSEVTKATKEDIRTITTTLNQHTTLLTQILELLSKDEK